MPSVGWLLFGLIWVVLGWRISAVPGAGWRGPKEWTQPLARTQFGRFISIAVGGFAILVGAVMMIAAVVALFRG